MQPGPICAAPLRARVCPHARLEPRLWWRPSENGFRHSVARYPPNPAWEKIAYIHNQWDSLQTFLMDSRVEMYSNRGENLIRPIALNRKNALFAGHDKGSIAQGRIASLNETCTIKGVEPSAYLKATLIAIENGHHQYRARDSMDG